jgi:hypothetical protein
LIDELSKKLPKKQWILSSKCLNIMYERYIKCAFLAKCWWLTPVFLATWQAEIGRITTRSQPQANSSQDTPPSASKITRAKWIGGVAQAKHAYFVRAKS